MFWSIIFLMNAFTVSLAAARHDETSLWLVTIVLVLSAIKSAITGWK